jgi:hypothetical protein
MRKRYARSFAGLSAATLLFTVSGCTWAQSPEPSTNEDDAQLKEAVPAAGSELVLIAKDDLAARLNINSDNIKLTRFDEVTWPDGSLGCPRKDMKYKQVLVNGSLIVLTVDGVDYHYHSGGSRPPFYCADPTPPVPGDGGGIDI